MTALPVASAPSPAPPVPGKAVRTSDTPNDVTHEEEAEGLFHEELARETSALQNQTPEAQGARHGEAAPDRAQGKEVRDAGSDAAVAVDTSLVAMLAGAIAPPMAPIDVNSLPAAAETPVADSSAAAPTAATASVLVFAPPATANLGHVRGAQQKWPVQASAQQDRPGPVSVHADQDARSLARASDESGTQSALAAAEAAAESAATGKYLHTGRDAFEPGTAFQPGMAQRHPAEALLAGMNPVSAAPYHATHTATIAAHLDAPGWDRGLGERVVWMAGQQLQVAELHLNPPELGPLQVTLTINNDQASAQFVSQHAAVREAIETAMPRLREMLAEGGIMLGNASVSAESFAGQAQQDSRNQMLRGAGQSELAGAFGVAQVLRATRGLIDIFA